VEANEMAEAMKRSPLRRRTPLQRSGRLRAMSVKRRAGLGRWRAVYEEVDQRSGGRCEVRLGPRSWRCPDNAVDHHHLVKPRASHHTAELIVHLCRGHHVQVDWPYKLGRLVIAPGGHSLVVFASDKTEARRAT
jgi:hypothetical protein